VGYFNTQHKERFSAEVNGNTFSGRATSDINVVHITLTLKGILPYKKWEFFGLGGIGAYIVSGDVETGAGDFDQTTTIFGGTLGLGFHYNITPGVFVGAEGKYLWTSNAKLHDEISGVPVEAKFKLDGIIATAVIGYRF